MTVISLFFTLGRFYIRWKTRRRFYWDDLFHGFAMVFLIAFASSWQVFGPKEYLYHLYRLNIIKVVPPAWNVTDQRWNITNILLFWCVVYMVKASFLALYWPIFELSAKFRIAWRIATAYTAVSFGITLLWVFWTCGSPVNYLDRGMIHLHG